MKLLSHQVRIEFQGIPFSPDYAPLQTKGSQQNLRGKSALPSCRRDVDHAQLVYS